MPCTEKNNNDKLGHFIKGFMALSDEGQDYVIAVQNALALPVANVLLFVTKKFKQTVGIHY